MFLSLYPTVANEVQRSDVWYTVSKRQLLRELVVRRLECVSYLVRWSFSGAVNWVVTRGAGNWDLNGLARTTVKVEAEGR